MLNPFPDLLTYSLLAPFILRLVAGLVFIDLGILLFKSEKERWLASFSALNIPNPKLIIKILGITEVISGIMLILGFYTQVASLILTLFVFAETYIEYKQPEILKRNFVFYIMLLSIVLSLLLSGAGRPAFDLPL